MGENQIKTRNKQMQAGTNKQMGQEHRGWTKKQQHGHRQANKIYEHDIKNETNNNRYPYT
jgi:hypothetical protein